MFNYSYILAYFSTEVKLFVYLLPLPVLRIGLALRLTALRAFCIPVTVYG